MTGAHLAMSETTNPPATAAGTSVQSGWKLRNDGSSQPTRWNKARLVRRAISLMST